MISSSALPLASIKIAFLMIYSNTRLKRLQTRPPPCLSLDSIEKFHVGSFWTFDWPSMFMEKLPDFSDPPGCGLPACFYKIVGRGSSYKKNKKGPGPDDICQRYKIGGPPLGQLTRSALKLAMIRKRRGNPELSSTYQLFIYLIRPGKCS